MRALALLGGAALAAAVLTACGGGSEPPSSPDTSPTSGEEVTPTREPTATAAVTPTATADVPTPPPESGGMDGFRDFVAFVERAADASFFAERAVEGEITCTGDEETGPCAGQPSGAVQRGLPSAVGYSDALALFTRDEYEITLEQWVSRARVDRSDDYGRGGISVHAIAHQPATEGREESYQIVLTGIFTVGPDALRQARILSWEFLDGSWRLKRELFATVPLAVDDWLSGECTECYDQWERWESQS